MAKQSRSNNPSSIALAAILLASALTGCTCGENKQYSVKGTVEDRGQTAKLSIQAIATSGLTRNGMLTSRRYLFTLEFPGREPTLFSIYNQHDKPLVSQETMQRRLPDLAIRVSTDERHFALSLEPYTDTVLFFHLLPKGEPLHIKAFDDKLGIQDLTHIAWDELPAPERIARDDILAQAAKIDEDNKFCMLDGPDHMLCNLEEVVRANLDLPIIADTVLEVWPACSETRGIVNDLVKEKAAPGPWLDRLRQKITQHLAEPKLRQRDLVTIVTACRALGDEALLHQAYRVAVKRWPADYMVHYDIFSYHVAELPPDVKAELLARAKKALESGGELEKGYARDVIKEAAANRKAESSGEQPAQPPRSAGENRTSRQNLAH